MTNAEKIKNMTDSELAEFLCSLVSCMAVKIFGEYVPNDKQEIERHLQRNVGEKWELSA